ncbi:Dynein heavy chain, outer arm, partial [Globisporangium splendens]
MANEELLLMTTLRDMNLSKLVAQDIPVFLSFLKDIFPGIEQSPSNNKSSEVANAIAQVLEKNSRIAHPTWTTKVLQFYDTTIVRHGVILAALSAQTKTPHKQIRMNPKAIRPEEMFGETDKLSGEWVDGVFAAIWSKFNDRSRKDISWIVCDGPVDAIWIENLNTVLDDNKILTLANGDRIPMTENCKLMFEVEDLRNASPATVSRAGIIYVSDTDMDWEPVVQGWLLTRPELYRDRLAKCVKAMVGTCSFSGGGPGHLFEFFSKNCHPVISVPRVALMQPCLNLPHSLLLRCELSESGPDLEVELERLFALPLCWTVGSVLDLGDRIKLNHYLSEKSPAFPKCDPSDKTTIFDHFLHSSTLEWEKWTFETTENLLEKGDDNVASLIIPNTDTSRSLYLIEHLRSCQFLVMLVGETGTGKSTIVRLFCESRHNGSDDLTFKNTELEKRGGKTFGPANGKKIALFLDDLSMPTLNGWMGQPTLEVVRQLIETNTLCFLDKDKRGDIKMVEDLRFLAAMSHPKGGKNDIPNRLKRRFMVLNVLSPTSELVEAIYGQMARWRLLTLTTQHAKRFWTLQRNSRRHRAICGCGCAKKPDPHTIFVDFLREPVFDEYGELVEEAPKYYENAVTIQVVRTRIEQLLMQFNKENPGVGGSGKQSLARRASTIAGTHIFQITKTYNLLSFFDGLRSLLKLAGQVGKGVSFVITEAEIKDEPFLEQINSLLATGEIPGLFPRDELAVMASELRNTMQKVYPERPDTIDNLTRFFFDRVRKNLHLLLCLSPVSNTFADRCREFSNLISGCTTDWFLPWPEEALVAVSNGYLENFPIGGSVVVKESLTAQMGHIHQVVVEMCGDYFAKMRRHVFQTPRSFLHFLTLYKELYSEKLTEINRNESSINIGLQKLVQGAQDVEKMKVILKEEETKLVLAEAAANEMLENLQIKSLEAEKENDTVQKIKEQCQSDATIILKEKEDAGEDPKKAQPFLDEAERAVSSIKPNDLNELKKLAKSGDIIKLIFDCVAILQMMPLLKVEESPVTLGVGKDKKMFDFVLDSSQIVKSGMLADTRFLQNIFHFSKYLKDNINDETIELMMSYMELEGFSAPVAENASKAAEGLFCWVKAMSMYHEASKVVKPKLEALRIAEGKFEAAQASLQATEEKLVKCQAVLTRLQEDFQTQTEEKAKVEEYVHATEKKTEQATALINGLAGEKQRWTEDSNRFVERKVHLVGDCALASAFLCYCSPFNREYRELLMLQRIPSDPLSIQNRILVARAARFPLLIDPQGQALSWVLNREVEHLPSFGVVSIANPKLRDHLEYCVSEGKALVLDGVDQDVDPVLNNILDRNLIAKAKTKFVNILDRMCEYSDDFRLYMTTRLPNPHFPPKLQARTMIVDFTVTQKGLEEQLLALVIQKEQKSLEEQLLRVQSDLNTNTKALLALDSLLLDRLFANTGNLLDDLDLIAVLANTKLKATEVNDKIVAAEEMKKGIDEKREHYQPVATRGSVLYFGIVEFSVVNVIYQISLDQFLVLFKKSIDISERSSLVSKRVTNIVDTLTYTVCRYINRGLYEKDKLSFLLMIALKILVTAECTNPSDIMLFLKAGASRKLSLDQPKLFHWMTNQAWLNAIQIASEKVHFRNLPTDLERSESFWKKWYEDNEPERLPLLDYESILFDPRSMTANLHFHRLLLIRSLREDRTLLAVNDFLKALEFVEGASGSSLAKLPAMGPRYTGAVAGTVESVFNDMLPETPVLYLLSPGADRTEAIELFARKKRQAIQSISMGERQEIVASKAINVAMLNGSWVLLQNCHLGLEYILDHAFSFSPETVVAKGQVPMFNCCIIDATEIEECHRLIGTFPKVDSPEVFGLHPNADLTYRVKEVASLLNMILETQPKDQSTGRGETREDVAMWKSKELMSAIPDRFSEEECISVLKARLGGIEAPLNIFLFQEIQRLQYVLLIVHKTLEDTQRAITGEIAITLPIRNTINAIFDGKVPRSWIYGSAGDEISWLSPTLGLWFTGLTDRSIQLWNWLDRGRSQSFWLAGFSNPQGLLTAMTQEVTRHHASERWALDDIVYHSEVTDYEKLEQIKQPPRDGILVHGLLVDGAAWNKNDGTLVEAEPKRLFALLPVVYVTATTKAQKKNRTNDYGPYGGYEAPCYKYALRTDQYYIFSVVLSSRDHRLLHWTLRGVALLCTADQ